MESKTGSSVRGLRSLLHVAMAAAMLGACGSATNDDPGTPGDDGKGPPGPPEVLTATIGAAGGTLEGKEGGAFEGFRLVVPAGALDADVELRVEGVIDPTPLPSTAAGIGPQFAILPAGLAFTVPVKLTVPFTPKLRQRWETPDQECRVWYRDGDAWARAEPIASSNAGVTVELGATTTAGAGVIKSIFPTGCLFNCDPPPPPVATCLDGDRLCIEKIGTQHVNDRFSTYSYTQGVLYWLTSPASNRIALAGFDVLKRQSLPTSGALLTNTAATVPMGEVVVDRDGARWLGIRNVGNVRFNGTQLPTLFDSPGSNLPLGVTLDTPTGAVIRYRYNQLTISAAGRVAANVSAVRDGRTFGLGLSMDTAILDEVLQLGRATSTSIAAQISASGWGSVVRTVGVKATTRGADVSCGNQEFASLRAVSVSQTRNKEVAICVAKDRGGALIVNKVARVEFPVGQVPFGLTTIDSRDTVYLADLQRAQLTRFATDGSITVIPLTSAAPSSDEYAAMIPESIHYDSGLDTLYVVTRGTAGTPAFHQLTKLR